MTLPIELENRFNQTGQALDLTNYPLSKLSRRDFDDFIKKLETTQGKVIFKLNNCGLDKLTEEQFKSLLGAIQSKGEIEKERLAQQIVFARRRMRENFTEDNNGLSFLPFTGPRIEDLQDKLRNSKDILSIELDQNRLSADDSGRLRLIHQSLQTLPALRALSIKDEGQTKVDDYFAGLAAFPFLRAIKTGEHSFSFLNTSAVKDLLNFLKKKPDYISCFLGANPEDINITQNIDIEDEEHGLYLQLIAIHRNIEELRRYRLAYQPNTPAFPPGTYAALQILDRLEGTGAELYYRQTDEGSDKFILDLTNTIPASFEKAIVVIRQELPSNLTWAIKLPTTLSHFAKEALSRLEDIPLIDESTPLGELNFNQESREYLALKQLNEAFNLANEDFYQLTTNREELFKAIELFKGILKGSDKNLKALVYEFFVVHQLLTLPTDTTPFTEIIRAIRGNSTAGINIEPFKKLVDRLLAGDTKIISQQINAQMLDQARLKDRERAETKVLMQAQVWWGMFSLYLDPFNSSVGFYKYGCFLHEAYPWTIKSNFHVASTLMGRRRGIYWLRLAATQCNNLDAQNYLVKLLEQENCLDYLERYHLRLACEQLQLGKPGESLQKYANLFALFPSVEMSTIFFHYVLSMYQSFSYPRIPDSLRFVTKDSSSYLLCLLTDDLLTVQTKMKLLQALKAERGWLVHTHVSGLPYLSQYQTNLERYHQVPLGIQLKNRLFPLLENKSANGRLDSKKPMKEHAEALRWGVFCHFFKEQLTIYLKKQTLLGTKIKAEENETYVAALITGLLHEGLAYFELEKAPIASEIHAILDGIKADLQVYFFKQLEDNEASLLSFDKVLAMRFHSYLTAASVSQVTQQTLSKNYGEKQHSEEGNSRTNMLMNTVAALVESLHIALPIIGFATGTPIPVIGCMSIIKALNYALKEIHHHIEKVEHILHKNDNTFNFTPRLLHTIHFLHDSFLHPHKEHALLNFKTLNSFYNLIFSAATVESDRLEILVKHWAAIYQPVTEKLTATSNTLLGILLMELLMRALTLRLADTKNVRLKPQDNPRDIPQLIHYLNETLWYYAFPKKSDDIQLVTRDLKTVSALSLIFPKQVTVCFARSLISIPLSPQNLLSSSPQQDTNMVRFASNYEVSLINTLRSLGNRTPTPFILSETGLPSVMLGNTEKVTIGYKEIHPLSKTISTQELLLRTRTCLDLCKLFKKKIPSNTQEKIRLSLLQTKLRFLNNMIESDRLKEIPQRSFLNSTLCPEAAIEEFIQQIKGYLVFLDRYFSLSVKDLKGLSQTEMTLEQLEDLVCPLVRYLNEKIQSVGTSHSISSSQGSFFATSGQPARVTEQEETETIGAQAGPG